MEVIRGMQATQQMTLQQLQVLQAAAGGPGPGPSPAPQPGVTDAGSVPDPAAATPPNPEGGEAEVDESAWWYQGPRTCRKCNQRTYLRGGICYNMDCVSWMHFF